MYIIVTKSTAVRNRWLDNQSDMKHEEDEEGGIREDWGGIIKDLWRHALPIEVLAKSSCVASWLVWNNSK